MLQSSFIIKHLDQLVPYTATVYQGYRLLVQQYRIARCYKPHALTDALQ